MKKEKEIKLIKKVEWENLGALFFLILIGLSDMIFAAMLYGEGSFVPLVIYSIVIQISLNILAVIALSESVPRRKVYWVKEK